MIIIADIDNCISEDQWRYNRIDWEQPQGRLRYHQYHLASVKDRAVNLNMLRYPDAAVFFLTGMPEEYRKLREGWLAWHGVHYERMLMRGDDHDINSVDLKRIMLRQLRAEGIPLEDCFAAYDDRRAVVAMFKEEGLPGVHLQIHEQEHMQHVV